MTTEKDIDKGISNIVGALTDPIIVFPGGWGDTLPDWLKSTITLERLVENVRVLKGEGMTGTDAEACAYLSTVSLTQPIDSDWTRIYLYVATRTCEKWRSKDSGVQMPTDIRVDSLTDGQIKDLERLKDWLYHTRIKFRQERDRAERREKREEKTTREKEEQPALFNF